LAFDFILSYLGFNPNKKSTPQFTVPGIAHPVYHHDLKKNLDIFAYWGPLKYRLCTNQFGFKVSCNNAKETRKDFDVAFIGDSFTEAIGMTYEDSFVGLYAQKHSGIAVANFGVVSYSPSIYWKKIEFLLQNGFTFKHLVVLPDISDIRDEALFYIIDERSESIVDNIYKKQSFIENENEKYSASENETRNTNEEENSRNKNFFHTILMKYFKFTWYINCMFYDYITIETDEAIFNTFAYVIEMPDSEWTRSIDSSYFGKGGVLNGIQKNLEYMRNLKQLLDKHNIKMTIVVYPWPAQLFFEDREHLGMQIWKDFCIKEGCHNFIDANPFFFDEIQKSSKLQVIKKYYIPGDFHFNKKGNKTMFEIINTHFKP